MATKSKNKWSPRRVAAPVLTSLVAGAVLVSMLPGVSAANAPVVQLDPSPLTATPPTTNGATPSGSTTAATSTSTLPTTDTSPATSTEVPATSDESVAETSEGTPSTDVTPPTDDAASTSIPETTDSPLTGGPNASEIAVTLLAAAPDSYGPDSLDDADSALAGATFDGGRLFACGDTILYFHVIEASPDAAAGSSTVSIVTEFEATFSDGGVGFTDVAATLATVDSRYSGNGSESIATDLRQPAPGEPLELTASVAGIDAGERILVEYRAILGCNDTEPPAGQLSATPTDLSVRDGAGNTTNGFAGQPVILAAASVDMAEPECPAPAGSVPGSDIVGTEVPGTDVSASSIPDDPCVPQDCEPYIVGEDGPLVLPDGCEQVSTQRQVAPGQVQNPTLPKQCGTAVTVVIDESGSISQANATQTVRNSLTALVNGLNNTGSTMAFVEFSSAAGVTVTRRAVTTATRSAFDNAITAYSPNGTTNWEDALRVANEQGGALTLVITDGNPNTFTTKPANAIEPSNTTLRPLYYGAARADTIKAAGRHMFVVGVGDVTPANLQVISGDIAYSSTLGIGQSDYIATSFSNLEQAIRDLVFDLCSSSLTITKTIGGIAQSGWTFTTTITGTAFTWDQPVVTGPTASVTSGANGVAQFQWSVATPGASVNLTINEASKPGNEFGNAVCTVSRPGQADTTVTVASLPITINGVPGDAIVKCDARNVLQATPGTPTITAGSCVGGVVTNHTITVPANTPGIVYTWTNQPTTSFPGTSALNVTVTATAQNGYIFFNAPAGWTVNAARTSATFTLTAPAASCRTVTPATPTAAGASCTAGAVTNHVITVPANTADITYTWTPQGTAGNTSTYPGTAALDVTVTATLVGSGTAWPVALPTGWTKTGNTTATFRLQRPAATCTPVQPGTPTAQSASCVSGAVTNHVITVPANTSSITYSWTPLGTGTPAINYPGTSALNVTVIATLAGTGVAWGTLPQGWTRTGNTTATFQLTASAGSCTQATPVAPTVAPAQCVNGATTTHRVTVATSTGITYSLSPPGSPAGTYPSSPAQNVTVTATLSGTGVAWPPTLPTGWTRVNDTTATFVVALPNVTCTPVQPVPPTVSQATCANGAVTTPTVVLPTTPTGVTYAANPAGPYSGTANTTVTVTATLASGFAWGQMPAGWTQVDFVTAQFTVNLVGTSCAEVTPVVPTVTAAQCVNGATTTHRVTVATTTGITYTLNPPGSPAGTYPPSPAQNVTVTATLAGTGVAWPATLPTGWTKVNATNATFVVALPNIACTPAQPVSPAVTQATCANGAVTTPTVVPATTPTGVSYVASPAGPYNGTVNTTVTVTASLATSGFAWDQMPAGWTLVDSLTARFTVTLVGAACDEVVPVAPAVVPAQCVNGATTSHVVSTATTTGITYTLDPPGSPAGTYPGSPGQSVTVTATLAAAGAGWPDALPVGWTKTSVTTATFRLDLPDTACTPVEPVAPTVTQATCRGGVVTRPTVMLATTPVGVSYVAAPPGPYLGTVDSDVTVTATLTNGFAWGQMPDGWTQVDLVTAQFTVSLVGTSCAQVNPVAPAVTEALCLGGTETTHRVTTAVTDGISYSLNPPGNPAGAYPASPAETVTVTATLTGAGVGWPATLPDGWTRTSDTTATFTVDLPAVACTPVQPVAPTVTQASSANGVVTAPTVELATSPPGVSYAADPQGPYSGTVDTDVVVTATLRDGFSWGQLPAEWTSNDLVTAEFTITLAGVNCAEVTPVAPVVTSAVCADGAETTHTIELADTDGITYTLNPAGAPAGIYPPSPARTVTVTATLDDVGVGWPATLPDGWTETSTTTAAFTVDLPAVTCTRVQPVAPKVTQATCASGAVTAPTVELATTPAGVSYEVAPTGPYGGTVDTNVVVTATLAGGFAWGQMPAGWAQVDPVTATFAVTLVGTTCDDVTPVAPSVVPAACVAGAVTSHSVTPAVTDDIVYSLSPPGSPDGTYPASPELTVTVTATLADAGVAWPDSLPTGWTETSATTATFTVDLPAIACTPVQPVAPTVTLATCADGVVTEPTVELPTSPGITYSVDPAGPYVGTVTTPVTVTATLSDGFAWSQLPGDWTQDDLVTAHLDITLVGSTCAAVTPVAPSLTPAVCTGGVETNHVIEVAVTDGIVYTLTPTGVPAGNYPASPAQTVTVTARLAPAGVGWPGSLPPGWTQTSASTATFAVELEAVACTPVPPTAPAVTQATCANGVVTDHTVELPTTPGITYSVAPPGPYDGTKDYTDIVVTATLAPGFSWEDMPPGWTQLDASTAIFPITLIGTTCDEVRPVLPTLTQAVCRDGVVEPPELEFAVTDGITYSAEPEGPYASGQPVTVTATLDDTAVGWPATLPEDWTRTGDTTATYSFTFDDVACSPVAPVAPTVVGATCVAGDLLPPTVTLAVTPGITYVADPPGPYDPTVQTDIIVTATLSDGFEWDTGAPAPLAFGLRGAAAPQQAVPPGWTIVDPATATFEITLPPFPPCPDMTPVAPQVSDPQCVDGSATEPSITLATTEGIAYVADPPGPYGPGDSVAVNAHITDEAAAWVDPLPAGWALVDAATATFAVTFANPDCTLPTTTTVVSPTTVAPTTTAAATLPRTGTNSTPVALLLGVLATAAGAVLTFSARRRRV